MSLLNNTRKLITTQYRCVSQNLSKNSEIAPVFTNRNPRNLEKLRIAHRPNGYHLEKPGKCFWHKLVLTPSARYVTASVVHHENGEVLSASTREWALKEQLYRTNDTSAYVNLGRVLAQRCLESGLVEIQSFIEPAVKDGKIALFLKALQDGGVCLQEPEPYKHPQPCDKYRPEKPWEVTE